MQNLNPLSSDWAVVCKISSYMILKITSNPAFLFPETPQSYLVSVKVACPLIDGINLMTSSRREGNESHPILLLKSDSLKV